MSAKNITRCIREYVRYSDTIAVLLAIRQLFLQNPNIAKFVGVEYKLKNSKGNFLRPDLVAQYNKDTKGLLFEVKWSLPYDIKLLEEKLRELKKYTGSLENWKTQTKKVENHDLLLVCSIDDAKRVVDAVKQLAADKDYAFMQREGFSIWSWILNPAKRGKHKEELRFLHCYGQTGNKRLEDMIHQTGGILVSEDVLTYLRFTFAFIPEKPPIQYTIATLIQNILPSFQRSVEKESYELDIDLIYDRAKSFFPSWQMFDTETIQTKRRWLREAIEKMCDLGMAERIAESSDRWSIPIPTLRPRGSIQESICKKIAKEARKRRYKGKPPRVRVPKAFREKPPKGQAKINQF
jgi:hypothetical protein